MQTETPKIIAIAVSDLHLSLKAPRCRGAEPSWFLAMEKTLGQLREMQERFDVPVLCAGDIFDRWNAPAELINWAIDHLPKEIYAIPGQHDLPQHNYEERNRSAFETLIKANRIKGIYDRTDGNLLITSDPRNAVDYWCEIMGFPFGFPIQKKNYNREKDSVDLRIAVGHEYFWKSGCEYPGAPKEKRLTKHKLPKGWSNYDLIILGDNHKGFCFKSGSTTVFNCGTFMRRKTDEIDYDPWVGLIYSDGHVEPRLLETKGEKIEVVEDQIDAEIALEVEEFMRELGDLAVKSLDFREMVHRYCEENDVSDKAKKFLLVVMGD